MDASPNLTGVPRRRTYVGIDISKDTLDVAGPGVRLKVKNERKGFQEILKTTQHLRYRHFICEPTGVYGRGIVAFLRTNRLRVSLVNPSRSRQFAKATGRRAKTDAIDAAMLAEMGETLRPNPTPAPPKAHVRLTEAVRFRRQLEIVQRLLRRQREQHTNRAFRGSIAAVLAVLAKQVKLAESSVNAAIVADARFAWLRQRFSLVAGFGARATENLLGALPEIGQLNGKKIAALAGLAPCNYDSGTSVKSSRIFGGRMEARESLYMPSLVATKHNAILRPFYRRLRAAGKPHRVALTAVMRKLLMYLNFLAEQPLHTPLPGQGVAVERFRRWTFAERVRLREKRIAGVSCKQIALEFGRPVSSVQRRIHHDRGREIRPRPSDKRAMAIAGQL
ncbi:MAG: IS110 family transposase [Verrucomicrobiota bacterium]